MLQPWKQKFVIKRQQKINQKGYPNQDLARVIYNKKRCNANIVEIIGYRDMSVTIPNHTDIKTKKNPHPLSYSTMTKTKNKKNTC